ncbi:hypothetical protein OJ997_07335 [Solirubrobacter phytolaccae]|uniref:Uncharacterized protein n=1 Tax=Solirubrobacter phytolaccae TaxID=1404360 RepID=A0A9X3N5N8_9ACTN|nr:hypothetical protein [Solirubrobacter phytolaccae]MDA0180104.1 hypothetical protein [Solirubrobacter phytolaccae]
MTAAFVALALLALPAAASAATLPKPARDCTKDGRIDGKYSKAELRKGVKALSTKAKRQKECKTRLNRALKRGGDGRLSSSSRSTKTILRDCANDGWLDRRYPVSALRTALKKLPTELEEYSDCGSYLRAEIKARTKKPKRD